MSERTVEERPRVEEGAHIILLEAIFKDSKWRDLLAEAKDDTLVIVDIMRAVANAYQLQVASQQPDGQRQQSMAFLEGCLRGERLVDIGERMGYESQDASAEAKQKTVEVALIMGYALPQTGRGRPTLRAPLEHIRAVNANLIDNIAYPEDEYHTTLRTAIDDEPTGVRLLAHMSDADQAPLAFVDTPDTRTLLSYLSKAYKVYAGQADIPQDIDEMMKGLLNSASPLSLKELARVHDLAPQRVRDLLQPHLQAIFGADPRSDTKAQSPSVKKLASRVARVPKPRTVPVAETLTPAPPDQHIDTQEKPEDDEEDIESDVDVEDAIIGEVVPVDKLDKLLAEIGEVVEEDGGELEVEAEEFPLLDAATEVMLAKHIEAGLYAQHLLETDPEGKTWPAGATAQELRRVQLDGEKAKERFVLANMRLVNFVARWYVTRHFTFEDLVNEGVLGLLESVRKFDFTLGYKFSTYATWGIRVAMYRGVMTKERLISLSYKNAAYFSQIIKVRDALVEQGRPVDVAVIAKEVGLSQRRVKNLLDYEQFKPVSLNAPVGDNGDTELGDLLADESEGQDVGEVVMASLRRAEQSTVLELISDLPPIRQQILGLRYRDVPMSYPEIGKALDMSEKMVRYHHNMAVNKLRQHARKMGLMDE